MTTILWDTNGTEIVKTLAAERRAAGALASGLALTLVVVADENNVAEASAAATTAAAAHPCRLLVVVRRKVEADDRLDAEVQVGGHLGANESVVMRMYGRLTLHAESVVLPLLASDAPVVTWWHGEAPEKLAYDALAVLASRRVTDASPPRTRSQREAARQGLRTRRHRPGLDPDHAVARAARRRHATTWSRSRRPPRCSRSPATPAPCCWPAGSRARLGVKVKRTDSSGPGLTAAEIRFGPKFRLRIDRPDGYLATLSRTGHVGPAAAAQAPRPRRPDRRGAAAARRRPAVRRRAVRGDRRAGPGRPAGQARARLARPDARRSRPRRSRRTKKPAKKARCQEADAEEAATAKKATKKATAKKTAAKTTSRRRSS